MSKRKWKVNISSNSMFTSITTTSSISEALKYAEKRVKNYPDNETITISIESYYV